MGVIRNFKKNNVDGTEQRGGETEFNNYLATQDGMQSIKSILVHHYKLDTSMQISIEHEGNPNRIQTKSKKFADNIFTLSYGTNEKKEVLKILSESAESLDMNHYWRGRSYLDGIKGQSFNVLLFIYDELYEERGYFFEIIEKHFRDMPGIDVVYLRTSYMNGSGVSFQIDDKSTRRHVEKMRRVKVEDSGLSLNDGSVLLSQYLETEFGFGNKSLSNKDGEEKRLVIYALDQNRNEKRISISFSQNGERAPKLARLAEIDKLTDFLRELYLSRDFISVDAVESNSDFFLLVDHAEDRYRKRIQEFGISAKWEKIRSVLKVAGAAFQDALAGYTFYDGQFQCVYNTGDFARILLNQMKSEKV